MRVKSRRFGMHTRASTTLRAAFVEPLRTTSTTLIAGIDTADGPVAEAYPPISVTLRLEDVSSPTARPVMLTLRDCRQCSGDGGCHRIGTIA
jgi:hypothetical protein